MKKAPHWVLRFKDGPFVGETHGLPYGEPPECLTVARWDDDVAVAAWTVDKEPPPGETLYTRVAVVREALHPYAEYEGAAPLAARHGC